MTAEVDSSPLSDLYKPLTFIFSIVFTTSVVFMATLT